MPLARIVIKAATRDVIRGPRPSGGRRRPRRPAPDAPPHLRGADRFTLRRASCPTSRRRRGGRRRDSTPRRWATSPTSPKTTGLPHRLYCTRRTRSASSSARGRGDSVLVVPTTTTTRRAFPFQRGEPCARVFLFQPPLLLQSSPHPVVRYFGVLARIPSISGR